MIKIEFTCKTCGTATDISADAIEEKTAVPVCDDCYKLFLSQKGKLVKSFEKKLKGVYEKYGIDVDAFNAAEEFAELES